LTYEAFADWLENTYSFSEVSDIFEYQEKVEEALSFKDPSRGTRNNIFKDFFPGGSGGDFDSQEPTDTKALRATGFTKEVSSETPIQTVIGEAWERVNENRTIKEEEELEQSIDDYQDIYKPLDIDVPADRTIKSDFIKEAEKQLGKRVKRGRIADTATDILETRQKFAEQNIDAITSRPERVEKLQKVPAKYRKIIIDSGIGDELLDGEWAKGDKMPTKDFLRNTLWKDPKDVPSSEELTKIQKALKK